MKMESQGGGWVLWVCSFKVLTPSVPSASPVERKKDKWVGARSGEDLASFHKGALAHLRADS